MLKHIISEIISIYSGVLRSCMSFVVLGVCARASMCVVYWALAWPGLLYAPRSARPWCLCAPSARQHIKSSHTQHTHPTRLRLVLVSLDRRCFFFVFHPPFIFRRYSRPDETLISVVVFWTISEVENIDVVGFGVFGHLIVALLGNANAATTVSYQNKIDYLKTVYAFYIEISVLI